jgi:predicted ATP-dependent serine protease
MAAAIAYGIILVDDAARRLAVSAEFKLGRGMLITECLVTQEIRVVLYSVMEAIAGLESYIEGLSCTKFGTHDLIIKMDSKIPVGGESYGLPLAMAIVAAMLRQELSDKTCFTGVIEPGGIILPVEDIDKKRHFAAMLGFQKIVLPSRQLDLLNSEINQCPVDSIYGAVGGYFWE